MTMLAASLAKAVSAVGGTGVTTLVVTGGLVAGIGAATATGAFDGGSADELAVLACPEVGPELARVQAGQAMLVTARTEDGAWLRIHFPEPGRTEAWVAAEALTVDGAVDGLPIAGCAAVGEATSPPLPGATLTAVADPFDPATPDPETPPPSGLPTPTSTPVPTPTGTPRPTPTPVPGDTTPPSVTTASVSVATIWNQAACGPTSTIVSATVTDAVSGVSSVTVTATNTSTGTVTNHPMNPPLIANVWTVTITSAQVGSGTITYTIRATDASANTTAVISSGSWTFTNAGSCDTMGPAATVTPTATITNSTKFDYTVAFNESASGLATGDFTLGGTAPGCAVASVSGSGSAYTASVACGGAGTVILTLAQGSVADAVGNLGPAANVVAATVTIDLVGPTVSLTSATRTQSLTPAWTITFNEAVNGLASDDLGVSSAGAACTLGSPVKAAAANAWTVTATCKLNLGVSETTVTVTIKANSVTDLAGNLGPPGLTGRNQVIDRQAPTISNISPALPGPGFICTSGTISSGSFLFAANVTDNGGVAIVNLVMTDMFGTVRRYQMILNKLSGKYEVRLSYGNDTSGIAYPWGLLGVHTYRIEAIDSVKNTANSASGQIEGKSCGLTTG